MQEGWFGTIYERTMTGCRMGGSEQSMRGLGRIAGMWFGTILEGARTGCRKGGLEKSRRGLVQVADRVVRKIL